MAKTYLITGASRGIGLELARRLLARGDVVIATARRPETSAGLQELGTRNPQTCTILPLDVTSDTSMNALTAALGENRAIDVVVNNAGVFLQPGVSFEDTNLDEVTETFGVNAVGPMRVARALLPLLRMSKEPVIANMSSKIGSIAENTMKEGYGYCMAKAALNMFTKMLSGVCPDVTCVSLHPGWVKTDMGGPNAVITPEESIRGLIEVLDGLTRKESGKFVAYDGRKIPW